MLWVSFAAVFLLLLMGAESCGVNKLSDICILGIVVGDKFLYFSYMLYFCINFYDCF